MDNKPRLNPLDFPGDPTGSFTTGAVPDPRNESARESDQRLRTGRASSSVDRVLRGVTTSRSDIRADLQTLVEDCRRVEHGAVRERDRMQGLLDRIAPEDARLIDLLRDLRSLGLF